jgi:hypothetical protein
LGSLDLGYSKQGLWKNRLWELVINADCYPHPKPSELGHLHAY